jgi:hypothetical protein
MPNMPAPMKRLLIGLLIREWRRHESNCLEVGL